MNDRASSEEDAAAGAASVRAERAEQAALATLIRVAKLVEADRLPLAAIDAALHGEWRLAVRLSRLV